MTQVAAAVLAIAGSGAAAGCLNRPLEPNDPRTTSTFVDPFTQSSVDKIDLILGLDNSRSMADKQQILAEAVPDLVRGLVLPKCLDKDDKPIAEDLQPTDPIQPCPVGTKHEFPPVLDIHIGILTSSLGGHGSDSCAITDTQACGGPNPSNNDAGHLISREAACGGQLVATYQNLGFLAWDPKEKLMPPGENKIGDAASPGIVPTMAKMVFGVGQVGCGYESQLESWYRFLIDPEPSKEIQIQNDKAVPTGIDDLLLKQRADFLRPGSLLAILMLTDENDCSIRESSQFYYAGQQRNPKDPKKVFHLPRGRAICATDPNSPCCKSCGQEVPVTCAPDPLCATNLTLSDLEDDINLRCWDNKKRFGIDFLYPIDRYTQALRSPTVPNRQGDLVPNPIFTDLNPNDEDTNVRDSGLVFLAGIVGVPWQFIARNPQDLSDRGFKNADELETKDADGHSTWDKILGDPATNVPPSDKHMIESITPRDGLAPPTSAPGTDPYNGHEYTISKNDDLQYACIFDLPKSRDCSDMSIVSCDCSNVANDNPLCDPVLKTQQVRAKAYPGLRELAALRSIGGQGVVASICPAQVKDTTRADYGYRPAIGAIIDRLKVALKGKCLPRKLTADINGQVQCLILEARKSDGECVCDPEKARYKIEDEAKKNAITAAQAFPAAATAKWNCFCEIKQTGDPLRSTPEELFACQNDDSPNPEIKGGVDNGKPANGWCYVDASATPAIGNPKIVEDCPETERRKVNFVGNGGPLDGSTLFITCAGE